MVGQLGFQWLVDVGFVLFVTAACLHSLFRDNTSADRRRAAWQTELKELEQTLRGLIAEAGAASSNLDRNLLQRKRELEALLKRIEEKDVTQQPAASTRRTTASPQREPNFSLGEENDLPNETWKRPVRKQAAEPVAAAKPKVPVARPAKPQEEPEWKSGYFELEQLINSAEDSVSLSQSIAAAVPPARREAKQPMLAATGLSEQIETINMSAAENDTFNMTSIMDQSTYRIARRLLKEGNELHIVARKLDLPVSEIRLLDKLMRREESGARKYENEDSVEQEAREKAEYQRNMGVIQAANLDTAIEREMALL